MDELILRCLQGKATPAEEEELQRWRGASAENEGRYGELRQLLASIGTVDPWAGVSASPPVRHLIAAAERRSAITPRAKARPRPHLVPWLVGGTAAAALVIIGFAFGHLRQRAVLAPADFVTGPTDMATVSLSDGTIVRLAPNSHLRFAEELGTRQVTLDGQAFFAVAHVKGRPFVVRTPIADALALGTRFEVRARQDRLRVLVLEGRVSVSAGATKVEVQPGHLSRMAPGLSPITEQVPDVYAELAWMGNFVAFQATPLSEVAREIERRYGIAVNVSDPGLAERTVTSWSAGMTAPEILLAICAALNARCSFEDSSAVIVR